jgi:hypothetical protein
MATRKLIAVVACLALAGAAACGDDDDTETGSSDDGGGTEDRLVDISMMRNSPMKHGRVSQACLTHDPRDKGCRPRTVPARAQSGLAAPRLVLAIKNPAAFRGHCPVAGDRGGHPSALFGRDARTTTPAAHRIVFAFTDRLVHPAIFEEAPFLNRDVNDALTSGRRQGCGCRTGGAGHTHPTRVARHARRWRTDVEN